MAKRNQQNKLRLFVNYQVDSVRDDSLRFRQALAWIAAEYGLVEMEVSIAIVDDATIHALNREHLDHDWPTDVISFVFEQNDEQVEGEIIASADTASRLCQAAGWSTEDELLLYVIHGFLHLAGLDDIEIDDQQEMRRAEHQCLLALNVPGAEEFLNRWDDISY